MQRIHKLIKDAGFVTVSVAVVRMYIPMDEMNNQEIARALHNLWLNGYLDKVIDGMWKPSKNFNNDANLYR